MKTLFRVLGAAAAVAVTGAAIVVLDKVLNDRTRSTSKTWSSPRKLKRTPPRLKRLPKPTPRARPRRPLPVTHGPLPLKKAPAEPETAPAAPVVEVARAEETAEESLRQRKRP